MIYFIQAEPNGRIKIGKAASPEKRLIHLQIGSPMRLKLLGTKEGDAEEEKRIHTLFYKHWSHGEWFEPVPELIEFIKRESIEFSLCRCECKKCGHAWMCPVCAGAPSERAGHTKSPKRVAAGKKAVETRRRRKALRQEQRAAEAAAEQAATPIEDGSQGPSRF